MTLDKLRDEWCTDENNVNVEIGRYEIAQNAWDAALRALSEQAGEFDGDALSRWIAERTERTGDVPSYLDVALYVFEQDRCVLGHYRRQLEFQTMRAEKAERERDRYRQALECVANESSWPLAKGIARKALESE